MLYCIPNPGGSEGKVFFCNMGDLGSIPGSGRSPGEGNGNPLWYSCLVGYSPWVTKSWTRLSDFTFFLYQILTLRAPPVHKLIFSANIT